MKRERRWIDWESVQMDVGYASQVCHHAGRADQLHYENAMCDEQHSAAKIRRAEKLDAFFAKHRRLERASIWTTVLWNHVVVGPWLRLVCKVRGCKWVDDSYGGPDSGCMAGHCERCGDGFHTTLY